MKKKLTKEEIERQIQEDEKAVSAICDTQPSMFERIEYAFPDEEFTIVDGFDDCIMGVCNVSMRVIYSFQKCVITLMERDGMDVLDAIEFMEYDVINTDIGDKTPIWCMDNH